MTLNRVLNMKESKHVFLGIKAHVVCINLQTGKEIWKTEVKRSQLISIVVEDDIVVAHAGGHLFGLDKSSGRVMWENNLPGLGYGYCFLATENNNSSSMMNQAISEIRSSNDGGGADAGGD